MVEMKRELRLRDRRGVSPVIATIIIVAIAIVMALAVAYWMLGLGGAFTRFEKLEFVSAYAEKESNGNFKLHKVEEYWLSGCYNRPLVLQWKASNWE
jgi:flagellin-like protein